MKDGNSLFFRHSQQSGESVKMSEAYFFDTYALIEIIKGSKNYEKYKDAKVVTTLLNLMELHYSTMKEFGKEKALMFFNELRGFMIEFGETDIINANYFKHKQGSNISYVDALGYVLSVKNGVKFLTGDKDFENVDGVEFVRG